MRIYLPLVAVSLTAAALLGLSAAAQNPARAAKTAPVSPHGNADAIGEDELQTYLYFLASDQLEGRNFPSRGYDTAALYVASHLAEWGLKPGGSAGRPGDAPSACGQGGFDNLSLTPRHSLSSLGRRRRCRSGERLGRFTREPYIVDGKDVV